MRLTSLAAVCAVSAAATATTLAALGDTKCCFTNPAFTGVCQAVPASGETCQSILDYLNNPNSTGKSYCGGTSIRGGWQQASCESDVSESARPDGSAAPRPESEQEAEVRR